MTSLKYQLDEIGYRNTGQNETFGLFFLKVFLVTDIKKKQNKNKLNKTNYCKKYISQFAQN